MDTSKEPNPPSRREEDFPKTNTIPDGWIMDALMEVYNSTEPEPEPDQDVIVLEQQATQVPATGTTHAKMNGKTHLVETDAGQVSAANDSKELFARRLDPFPSAWDVSGMWL